MIEDIHLHQRHRGQNDLLTINTKLGCLNSLLDMEYSHSIPHVTNIPTTILGMDISHVSPSQSIVPFITMVVNSKKWTPNHS